jgi:predicted nucleic acid-binding protein
MTAGFVVDNSVVMAWCFKDESDAYADRVLKSLTLSSALAPTIWPLELVNVLLAAERRKRICEEDSMQFIALLNRLPIRVGPQPLADGLMDELVPLARKYGLSSYDASYLHLAIRHGIALATRDEKLRAAAKKAKVPIWVPK